MENENILVWLPSPIGDAILSTPALRAIRQYFPDADITFLARSVVRDILSPSPFNNDWIVPETNCPIRIAKTLKARVVTNDFNLNKIAQLQDVEVININDLAQALRPVVLPGEEMEVKIIRPGEETGQGVGYLEDGTMVVVEQGRDLIGRDVTVVVNNVYQTSAGRMIFGKPADTQQPPSHRPKNSGNSRH